MMRVRDATDQDILLLTDLHFEITRSAYRGLFPSDREPPRHEELRKEWTEVLDDPDVDVVVVESDVILGSAVLRTDPERPARGEVKRLHVRPDSWRQGIGTVLLQEISRRAATRGFSDLSLWVIDVNQQARTFFEATGWELVPGSGEYNERLGITAVQYIPALQ